MVIQSEEKDMAEQYTELELMRLATDNLIIISTDSSFVEAVSYDLKQHTVGVTVQGKDYEYLNVPFDKFQEFVNSESKGSYFNRYVKGKW
jgi:hypothetical protein